MNVLCWKGAGDLAGTTGRPRGEYSPVCNVTRAGRSHTCSGLVEDPSADQRASLMLEVIFRGTGLIEPIYSFSVLQYKRPSPPPPNQGLLPAQQGPREPTLVQTCSNSYLVNQLKCHLVHEPLRVLRKSLHLFPPVSPPPQSDMSVGRNK